MNQQKLSPKREAFAQAVASGLSQADSYRQTYNLKSSTGANSIHQMASKLSADIKVKSRIDELKKEH